MKYISSLKKDAFSHALVVVMSVLFSPLAFGASGTWTNPSGGSWTNTANWSGGTIADGTDALADFSTLDLIAGATVTLDGARTVGSLTFGDTTPNYNWALNTGSAGPLTLAVSSGTPAITVNNQTATLGVVLAGTAGFNKLGTGTLALTGANTIGGTITASTGTLTFSGASGASGGGSLLVGPAAGNSAVVNLSGSGTRNFYGTFNIGGVATGVGAVNQTGGTANTMNNTGYIQVGSGGYGAYVLSGGTLANVGQSGIRVGYGSLGSYLQTGGTYNCNRYFAIGGNNSSGVGVATVTGGNLNVTSGFRLLIPDAGNATGVLNIGTLAGGNAVVSHLSGTGVILENSAGGNGTLNLNGGTLSVGAQIKRGNNSGGSAVVNLNGGTVQAGANSITLIDATPSSVNVYNGGVAFDTIANTATVSATLLGTSGNGVYPSGGTIAVPGGGGSGYIGAPLVAVTTSGSGSGAMAIANVSGGVVTSVTMTCPGQNYQVGDTLIFTFNGGGYSSAASVFNYMLTSGDLAPNVVGGVIKSGSGTLSMTAKSTYTGGTLVNAGTLNITADGGLGAGKVTVANGATLTLSGGATNGYIATAANFVIGSSAVANLNFTGTNTVNGLSLDGGATYVAIGTYGSSSSPAANQDDTHFTGTGVINVTAQPVGAIVALNSSLNPGEVLQSITFTATVSGSSGTPTGTVTFKDGAATLSTVTLNGSGIATYSTSALLVGTHTITANYNGNLTYATAVSSPVNQVVNQRFDIWTGAVNSVWDIATTTNWTDLGNPAVYHDTYDQVQFDDTASGSTDISLGTTVAPYSVIVSNVSKNYSLSGAGAISGSSGLTKFGAGTLTISNANTYVGNTLIQAGALNFNGSGASSGNGILNLSNGVMNVAGSSSLAFGSFTSLGGIAGNSTDAGNGVIKQTGGTVSLGSDSTYLELGAGDTAGTPSAYGYYGLSGGSLSAINGAGVRVGASGMGVFRQTGGTLYSDRWFAIGTGSGLAGTGGGIGEATFTGGTASLNVGRRFIVADKANATGVLNIGTMAGGNAAITALNNSGGRGALEFIDSAGALSGTVNFDSGTLTLAGSIYRNSTLGEIVNINFNGGVVQAANSMSLIDPTITYATIYNGGLVLDSQAYIVTNSCSLQPAYANGLYPAGGSITVTSGGGSGYAGAPLVTVSGGSGYGALAIANISGGVVTSVTMTCPGQYYQAGDTVNFDFAGGGAATPASTFSYTLQAGDVTANNGGLTKLGTGTLVLSGNNSYTGPTLINGGTLQLNTTYTASTGDYIITNSGTLNVGLAYAGSQLNVNNFTFAGPSASALTLDLTTAGSIAAAPINASGVLNVTGVATINILVGGLGVGQYPLIQYGSLGGSGSFALGTLPVGVQAHLVTNTVASPNSIDLVVTSGGQPRWSGQVSGNPNGTWDINTTANWIDILTSQTETYKEGQPVLFDDTASGTTTLNLVANVHPGNVTFNNNGLSYTLGGTNKISGTTGLAVQGNGSVTIQNGLNDYTGVTVVGGGTLNVTNLANGGSPSAIGAASASPGNLILTNGGNLVYSGPSATVNRGYTVGAGGGTLTLNTALAISGQAATTDSGIFTKSGPATLSYTGTAVNQLGATNNVKQGTEVLDGSAGSQSNSVPGLMLVGSDGSFTGSLLVTNSALGVGALTVDYGSASLRSGATVTGNSTLSIGQSPGASASVTVADNAVLNYTGIAILGGVNGNGVLNLNSSGAYTLATGGAGQRFCIGGTDTTGDGGAGAVNMTAGTLNTAPSVTDYIELGAGDNNAYGAFNLSGGSVIEPSGFGVRVGGSGLGVYNQTGGTLSCGRYFAIGTIGGFLALGGQGVATFSGGTATVNSGFRIIVGDKTNATAVFNLGTLAGGTAAVTALNGTGVTMLGDPNTVSGIINLNSGTLQLGGPIYKNTGNTTGVDLVNLNGGTLQAGANNITLANNSLDSVNVYNGGIKVDSQANSATISAVLGATTGNGVYPASGVIAVTGGGGTGYIGQPLVSVTTSGSGSNVTANANIAGGVVASVTITCPGQGYVAGDHLYFAFTGGGTANPASTFDYTLQAGDLTANGTGGLTKLGSGALTLSSASTYAGATTVSNGTLLVNGSLAAASAVTVASGGTLGGTGTVGGTVAVNSGATLAPGTGIGTLTVGGNLTLNAGSTNTFEVNASTLANDMVVLGSTVAYGGTLNIVTNGAFTAGQTFTLFSGAGATSAGNFTGISGSPGAGLQFAFTNGVLSVVSTTTTYAFLTNSVSGNTVTFTWPAGQGWLLQSETNSLSVGLTTNAVDWKPVSGGIDGSNSITIDSKQPAVFYRLSH